MRILSHLLFGLCLTVGLARGEDPDRFEVFRRLSSLGLELVLIHSFADQTVLDSIDRLAEGESIPIDIDEDGVPELLAWHEGVTRVVGIDEDGDLAPSDRRVDTDSDSYLVDLDADGAPDRFIDYFDLDSDGDPDRQDLYEITRGPLGASGVAATIVLDLDDDNRLFHLSNYTYHANHDQWRSDFDGNVCFLAALRDEASGRWKSALENPFCFYDRDGDGYSDEALRLEGEDQRIDSIRWSFDLDGDAATTHGPDYDFSLTAIGPIQAPEALMDSLELRDGQKVRFVSWEKARDLARWGLWRSILLVWDEEDQNCATAGPDRFRERWEGVIADPFRGFPAVGGPSCGQVNKRYEIDRNGSGRLALYWSDVDKKIHLRGAEEGQLRILLPGQPSLQREIAMTDVNANGFFDRWSWSLGGGSDEQMSSFKDEAVRLLPLDSDSLRSFWKKVLADAHLKSQDLFEPLDPQAPSSNPIRSWWLEAREQGNQFALRAERSLEAERFLFDLALLEQGGGLLAREPDRAEPALAIPYHRTSAAECPVEISIAELPESAQSAISAYSLIELVSETERVGGQIDDANGDGRIDRIVFPASSATVREDVRLEIQPASPLPPIERVRVDPYFKTGIAFESRSIAFRTYDGVVDLFTKTRPALILRGKIGDYHTKQPWGVDPLLVGDGPGIGGLYVFSNREWRPLFGPRALTEQAALAAGPSRAIIRVNLAEGPVQVQRTLELDGEGSLLLDEIRLVSVTDVKLAAALPSLESGGQIASGGIWTFGESAPGTGRIGLAGRCLSSGSTEPLALPQGPALRFELTDGEAVVFGWTVGGEAYGDSTAADWRDRAARLLSERSILFDRCP